MLQCLTKAPDAKPYITGMKAASTGQLLAAMVKKYATGEPKVRTIGLQPGESLHEVLVEGGPDSSQVEQYTNEELHELV